MEDTSLYALKSFHTLVIYIGGNDCSKNTNEDTFVKKYKKLISLIKVSNPACTIYISKIAPRGDVDVSSYNKGIQSFSNYWEKQNVKYEDCREVRGIWS